jgi:hypothetical protein
MGIGAALLVAGAGVATPIAYHSGYHSGRRSAEPIVATASMNNDPNWHCLENVAIMDRSGRIYSLPPYAKREGWLPGSSEGTAVKTIFNFAYDCEKIDSLRTQNGLEAYYK